MPDISDYKDLPDSVCEEPRADIFENGMHQGEPINTKNENWEKRELARKLAEVEAEKKLMAEEQKKMGKALEGSILETEYRSYWTPKDEVVHNTLRAFSVDYLLINTNSERIQGNTSTVKVISNTYGVSTGLDDQPFIGGYEAGSIENTTVAGNQMRDYFNSGHGGDYSNSLRASINSATSGKYQKMRIAPNTIFALNPLFRGNNWEKLYNQTTLPYTDKNNNYDFDRWRYGDVYSSGNKNLIEKFVDECLNNQYTRGYNNFICVVPVIKYINENVIDTEVFFNTLDRGDIFTIIWACPRVNAYPVYQGDTILTSGYPTPTCLVKCSLPLKKKYHGKNCYSAPVVDSQFGEHIKTQALDEMSNMAKDRRYDETDAGLSGRAAFKRAHGNPYLTHVSDTVVIPAQKKLTSIVQQQGIASKSMPKNALFYKAKITSPRIFRADPLLVSDVGVTAEKDDNMNSIVDVSFSSHAYITVKV